MDVRARVTNLSLSETRNIFKSLLAIVGKSSEQRISLCNLTLDSVLALKKSRRPSKDVSNSSTEFDVIMTDLSQACSFGTVANQCDHSLFDWNVQLPFCSPETLLRQIVTSTCDVWSLGVILFALLSGELPFYVEDLMDRARLMEKIKVSNCIHRCCYCYCILINACCAL